MAALHWLIPFIWRDLRSGILRWLALAVALAVAALSSVSLFADRIERGLQRDAAQLLGADVVALGDQPLPDAWRNHAKQMGLRVAQTAAFPSMARADDAQGGQSKLVAIKAVDDAYPLRGTPTLRNEQGEGSRRAPVGGPAPSTVWVDAGLLPALNLRLGDTLWLGDAAFKVAAVIAAEPDRGAGFTNFSPRVMMRWSDLPATGLIQPASRVTWRLLVAGAPHGAAQASQDVLKVAQFTQWAMVAAKSVRGARVETLQDGRPEMRATIDRAGTFLRLVAMLSVLVSAVVVAMVARDFAVRRLDDGALLRVMGVSQRAMLTAYVLELVLVATLAGLVGLALGGAFHLVFVWLLADLVQVNLPLPGWWPLSLGMVVALTLTLGFGLSPLIQLSQVPALRVLRRDLGQPKAWAATSWVLGVLATVVVLGLAVGQPKLAVIALGGMLVAVVVLVVLSALLLRGLAGVLDRPWGQRWPMAWRHAARALVAQPAVTITQLCALSLGLLAVFLLVLIRGDLVSSWRQATPPDAPDRFVINIQPDQAKPFQQMLSEAGVSRYDWYPMARGRLVALNGRQVQAEQYTDDRARRLVEREFNLSHAADMPGHNTLVAGRYVSTAAPVKEISLEEGLAKTLGVKLGDAMTFAMAGQVHTWQVTSLRKVNWASMRVNFFAMVPAAAVSDWPVTYISAYRQPESTGLDQQLVRQFPNLTVVDVALSLSQVQQVLDQVIAAVEFLFVFTLVAGILVLVAGLWSSREQRGQSMAVMRAMGAGQDQLQRMQRLELLALGALAGALASVAALAIGSALAIQVFEFDWQPPWWGPLGGLLVGAGLVWLVGWWSLRGLLQRSVLSSLRAALN